MKTVKTFLTVVLSTILFATAGVLAACGDKPDPAPKTYTVTANFDPEKGNIALDPSSADHKYAENTALTVTVTANTGFAIETFTVNGTETALGAGGTYSLTVKGDTMLAATFTESAPKTYTVPDTWYGTYYRQTGSDIIVIDEEGLHIDEEICPVTVLDSIYHTEWKGVDYVLSLNRESYSYGVFRLTSTVDNGATEINFYEADDSGTFDQETQGTWYDSSHKVTLVIGEKSVTWNDAELPIITIGTDYYGRPDFYVLYEGKVMNIYAFGNQGSSGEYTLDCYIGSVRYSFVKRG